MICYCENFDTYIRYTNKKDLYSLYVNIYKHEVYKEKYI